MICPHCLYDNGRALTKCVSCTRILDSKGERLKEPLVGRSRELAVLDDQLDGTLKNKEPRMIALVGRPGVGRSRLMRAFRARHDNAFSDLEAYYGYPVPGGSAVDPFAPFGRLLRNCLRLDESDEPVKTRQKTEAAVRALGPASLSDALRSLGYFLRMGFDRDDSHDSSDGQAPEEDRRRALASYAWYIRQLARRQPLLLLVEGLGQSTADGLELLAYLRAHLSDCPLLVLCEVDKDMFGDDPAFFQRYGTGVLPMEPLDAESTGDLLMALVGRANPPPANLLDRVMDVTSGLPASIIQVAETLQKRGIVHPEVPGWGVDAEGEISFDFPLTVAQAAQKNLDDLGEELLEWLRRAAVVGPIFWGGALIPLARFDAVGMSVVSNWVELPDPSTVSSALKKAVELGLIQERAESSLPMQTEYAFTHALERDLLREHLARSRAAAMHALVAQWLEVHLDHNGEARLGEIAAHYEQGGHVQRAAVYYIMVGDRARHRFANDLAVEAFEKALSLLDPHLDALSLMDVQHALGALYALGGRHDRAEAAFNQMLSLAWELDHRAKAGAALNRLGRLFRERGNDERAETLIEQGRVLFEAANDLSGVAASIDDLGQVAMRCGQRERALRFFNQALDLRRSLNDERSIALTLTNLARFQRDAGYLDEAEDTLREGLQIRKRIQDTSGVVASLLELAELDLRRGSLPQAAEQAERALDLARRTGDRGRTARALVLAALVAATDNTTSEEPARTFAAEAGLLADQLGDIRTRIRALRAQAMARRASDTSESLELLDRATRLARHHGDTAELGLLCRVRAETHASLVGLDIAATAVSARTLARQSSKESIAGTSDIGYLIDSSLAEGTLPPEVQALDPDALAHLRLAIEAYRDATAILREAGDTWEEMRTLAKMAELVSASGDVQQADGILTRARRLGGVLTGEHKSFEPV